QLRSGLMPKEQIFYEPIPYQLAYPLYGTTVWAEQLRHPNPYVSHFTVRPVSNLWEFTLAFVRSAREKRPDLTQRLKELVGGDSMLIVPRVYQITGEFDFVVPAYTIGDEGIHELVRRISKLPVDGNPSIIRCRIPDAEPVTERQQLSEAACKMVRSL